jgi:type II secretory pathway pseudopilin PulG
VLLALLLFLALASLAAALAAEGWATARQREREAELLCVGEQYRRAIESYWRASPGPARTLPASIGQLLLDDRFPMPVTHLRRRYADPITGEDLALVRQGPAVAGVYSRSKDTPLKTAGFPPRYLHFSSSATYDQWRFVFHPPSSRQPGRPLPGDPSPMVRP